MRCPAPHSVGATVLLAIHLLGCSEWHVEQTSPQALLEAKHPTRVRVTLRDSTGTDPSSADASLYGQDAGRSSGGAGAAIVLANPSIIGDSLVGQRSGGSSAIAVADISSVAIRRTSAANTLLLIGGIGLVIAGGAALVSSMGEIGN